MIRLLSKTTVKILTVGLAICVFHVYVIGRGSRPAGTTEKAAANTSLNELVVGRLSMDEDQFIWVNGNSANAGTTIFSGSHLQTPDGVEAVLEVGSASLYLEPNTDLTVHFDRENIDVKVAAGNASVVASREVKYSVTTPDGKIVSAMGTEIADPGDPSKPWHKWSKKQKAALIMPLVFAAVFIPLCIAKCGGNESTVR